MIKPRLKFLGLIFTVCLAVCSIFAGCATDTDYAAIYDDDARIAKCSSNVRIGSSQVSDKSSFNLNCKSISGCYIIVNSFVIDEEASATLSLEVTAGKCKVVLVQGEDVYTVAEGTFDGALELNGPEGKYKVKVVGLDAQIRLKLKY